MKGVAQRPARDYHAPRPLKRRLFYDNPPPSGASPPGMIAIERIYAINVGLLSEEGELALLRLYERLPGFDANAEPCTWFGASEDQPPWLQASAEPSGLLVAGVLPASSWDEWNAALLEGLESYPYPLHEF